MGTITWLGEGEEGAKETTFAGLTLKSGEAVECDDQSTLARAAKNRYFKVEGYEAEAKQPEDEVLHRPPSQQSAQGPVPKAGEPVVAVDIPEPPPPPESTSYGAPKPVGFSPIPPAKK